MLGARAEDPFRTQSKKTFEDMRIEDKEAGNIK